MLAPSSLPINQAIDYHPLTATPETLAFQVIALMSQAKASCVLITDQQRLVGIFTERDVVKLTAEGTDLENIAIAAVMTAIIISLKESEAADMITVLSLFRQHRIRHLPIIDDLQQLLGVITYESIREILQPADLLRLRRVCEVMTAEVVHAPLTASILNLTQLMTNNRVSCVVIVEYRNENIIHPLGIVTERDIVKLRSLRVDLNYINAQSIMSHPLLPISAQDPLWLAHQKMYQHRIRRLVVIGDTGDLVGIVTQSSMLQVLDPIEMCTALDALQRVVDERTVELKQANEQLQNQIARERLMTGIAQRIRHSLNLETILNTTVEEVRQFLQADRVIIYRFNPNWSGVFVVESVSYEWEPLVGKTLEDHCFAAKYVNYYKNGGVYAIADIYNENLSQCHIDLLVPFQIRANLVVPILRGEELWGLLGVHQCSEPRIWIDLEIELLKQLGLQLGIAIQQSELYQQLQIANQQLEVANRELQRIATLDGLTQVGNRRYFDEHLEREWRRMIRDQKPIALILCDIDYFKFYNDTYGHQIGDGALQQVANAIKYAVKRPADLVARYGGEEFAAILPNTDAIGGFQVAQEIHSRVKNLKISHSGSKIGDYITLSIGVASTIPIRDSSPQLLISAADKALYKAKDQGRDRVVLGEF